MSDSRPNILLLMTDQQRGDCLGIEGHPVLQTPYLDELGTSGFHFTKAYSACPVCVPARRTLMTGKKPVSHGVLNNYGTRLEGPTLPEVLSRAGYQTHFSGKLHLWPFRKLYGFNSADYANNPDCRRHVATDYTRFLESKGLTGVWDAESHGISNNGFPARPFQLEERYHFSNWVTDCGINFIERRDPTVPFFLKLSYLAPHHPLVPPQAYWDRYMNMDLPEPKVADWARVFDRPQRGIPVDNPGRVYFDPAVQKQMQAGYYGSINHVDNQIGRIFNAIPKNVMKNTIVIFLSDHGEMLGDHQWVCKCNAFEPSIRIPFLIKMPDSMGLKQKRKIGAVVELMDVMPTVLDAVGLDIPDSVDGKSLMPLLTGEKKSVRNYLHGECSNIKTLNSGMQYLTDGRKKYIYYPGTGEEHYFDIENDPCEMTNLAGKPEFAKEIKNWRELLMKELKGRPEKFTDGRKLNVLGGPTPKCLPEYINQVEGGSVT
ncbi:MAG TPA: sulfatase-like hydrolase/transferase [Victivallales bacterium]|nr:sulfatase-like hydrolase/transferase [Victivallales bacterium]